MAKKKRKMTMVTMPFRPGHTADPAPVYPPCIRLFPGVILGHLQSWKPPYGWNGDLAGFQTELEETETAANHNQNNTF